MKLILNINEQINEQIIEIGQASELTLGRGTGTLEGANSVRRSWTGVVVSELGKASELTLGNGRIDSEAKGGFLRIKCLFE